MAKFTGVPAQFTASLDASLDNVAFVSYKLCEKIRIICEKDIDLVQLKTILADAYEAAKDNDSLRYIPQKGVISFPFRHAEIDMQCQLKESSNKKGLPWNVYLIQSLFQSSPARALYEFAIIRNPDFLKALAGKALCEKWDFQGGTSYQILESYIKYTFFRLNYEKKIAISTDQKFASFNTGLVDNHYDDIFACFVPNTTHGPAWKFYAFSTTAEGGAGKDIIRYFNPIPEVASYFDRKEDLLFDLDKTLISNVDHIVLDNLHRLPFEFLYDECHGTEHIELLDKIHLTKNKKDLYKELRSSLEVDHKIFSRIRNRINDSISLAKKQIRWNYKTAVPCFYPRKNNMSLMLPLALVTDDKPDVALVVELQESGNYQGQTILTLQMAYTDARLVCRPDSEWLNTEKISPEYDGEE